MHTPHTFTLWTEEQITIPFYNSALLFTGMGSGLFLLCEDFNAQALIPLFNFQVPPQQNPTPVFFIAERVLCGGAAFSAAAVLVAGPPSGTLLPLPPPPCLERLSCLALPSSRRTSGCPTRRTFLLLSSVHM